MRSGRLVLLAGFGSILAIIALSGWDALLLLQQFRQEDAAVRRQFLLRNRLLNNIRSELYLSGTYVRDYLLDPEPSRAAAFGNNLAAVRRKMDAELSLYAGQMETQEAGQFSALRSELNEYWQILDPVLHWDMEQRRARGYAFLRDELFPRRTAMLEIAGRIADIDEQQVNAGNLRTAGLLDKFQGRVAWTLVAALALGLAMALFSMRKILQLEVHAQTRLGEVEEARRQMTNLSARLVDAQENERRSLSRELHDEIGQSLSAVLIELRNLANGIGAVREDQSRAHIERIKRLVEGAVDVARNMALLLRPSMLDDLGLVPALRWQADQVAKRTGMNVLLETRLQSEDLPDEYKTCIYRVVQEALHNCSRHADARNVRICVEQEAGRLRLTVRDDGRGFEARKSTGLGLLGMEERVTQLGGTFHVGSRLGEGVTLSAEIPFVSTVESGTLETDSHPVGG
jgi:signal transduction histidine kinase